MTDAALLRTAVSEAPHAVSQEEVLGFVRELFHGAPFDVAELASVFAHAGVGRRTFALPLASYAEAAGPEERNAAFRQQAHRMLARAARRAVPDDLRSAVTHVICVTTTGVATPSLECAVMEELGLPEDARRIPLFGLGCAGGVAGLALAADLARADPDALVLLLCVELTSLTFLRDDLSRRNFVACALFGDGAAAALVGSPAFGRGRLQLGRRATRLFPGTRDLMGWRVRDRGWEVVFSPRIPALVRRHGAELVERVAPRPELVHFALHPGGRKVLDAYRDALELEDGDLAPAEDVLARHGNLSSATVLFVLDALLADATRPPGPGIATAFGPGFTAELLAFDLSPASA